MRTRIQSGALLASRPGNGTRPGRKYRVRRRDLDDFISRCLGSSRRVESDRDEDSDVGVRGDGTTAARRGTLVRRPMPGVRACLDRCRERYPTAFPDERSRRRHRRSPCPRVAQPKVLAGCVLARLPLQFLRCRRYRSPHQRPQHRRLRSSQLRRCLTPQCRRCRRCCRPCPCCCRRRLRRCRRCRRRRCRRPRRRCPQRRRHRFQHSPNHRYQTLRLADHVDLAVSGRVFLEREKGFAHVIVGQRPGRRRIRHWAHLHTVKHRFPCRTRPALDL